MAQIQKGDTFTDGELVTGARLNQLVDSAVLLPNAITDQPDNGTSNVKSGDSLLIHNDYTSQLNKVTVENLFSSGIQLKTNSIEGSQISPYSGNLSIGSFNSLLISNNDTGYAGTTPCLLEIKNLGGNIEITATASGYGHGDGDITITSAGDITLDAGLQTIQFSSPVHFSSSTNIFPTGAVMIFANTTVPSGWLECNGQAVSRTASNFTALFAAIGTTYGVGDGVNTFNVPDLRGEFVRGYDHGRGIDVGRTIGSHQDQQLEKHKHIASNNDCQSYASVNGVGTGTYNTWCDTQGIGTSSGAALTGDGTHIEQTAKLGTETRPRNVAMMYCIKL